MSPLVLLGIVGILYIFTGISYLYQGNVGLGIVFISYAIANAGLMWVGK